MKACHISFCKFFEVKEEGNCFFNGIEGFEGIESCQALKLSNKAGGIKLFCVWTYIKKDEEIIAFATTCGEDFPIWELPNKSYKYCPGCGHEIKGSE